MTSISHITPADGNVFADLGFEDAANLKIRAALMRAVIQWAQQSDLKDEDAAKRLGVGTQRLSEIRSGRLDKCSIERLVMMLSRVGIQVMMTLKQPD